jgi:predicted RNA-binding Zn-ribbon protein involved in translation (DUF1610 family)
MNAEHQFDNFRNSRKPEEDVAVFADLWKCPTCREVNSEEKQECVACGQRVAHVIAPSAAGSNMTAPAHAAAGPLEEIRGLATSVNDWVCPCCGATICRHTRPDAKLQLTAQLLLVGAFLVTAACFFTEMAMAKWIDAVFFPVAGKVKYELLILPSSAVAWWALSLPRVVLLRCPNCGLRHRRYRAAPGFFRPCANKGSGKTPK